MHMKLVSLDEQIKHRAINYMYLPLSLLDWLAQNPSNLQPFQPGPETQFKTPKPNRSYNLQ